MAAEGRQRLFSRYGFDWDEEGEAEAFLESYRDMLKECCEKASPAPGSDDDQQQTRRAHDYLFR